MENEAEFKAGKGAEPERDDFELREWETTFRGERYKLLEPTLPEGLALQDNYFQLAISDEDTGKRTVQIKLKEQDYIRAVCSQVVVPAINVDKLPLRAHKEIRALVREWERKTGFGDLISALETQVGDQS